MTRWHVVTADGEGRRQWSAGVDTKESATARARDLASRGASVIGIAPTCGSMIVFEDDAPPTAARGINPLFHRSGSRS